MCRSKTERDTRRAWLVVAAITAGSGALLAGCSDTYLTRRDTVALSGGDAIAGNTITQMVDPWPPYSGNKNIAFNGEKMEDAVKRYRTGKVVPPEDSQAPSSNVASPSQSVTQVNVGGSSSQAGGAVSTTAQ